MNGTLFMVVANGRDPAEALQSAVESARRACQSPWRGDESAITETRGLVVVADSAEEVLSRAEARGPRLDAEGWEALWLPQLLNRVRRGPPSPRLIAEVLLLIGDERIDQMRGTAGCIALSAGSYLIFGRSRW